MPKIIPTAPPLQQNPLHVGCRQIRPVRLAPEFNIVLQFAVCARAWVAKAQQNEVWVCCSSEAAVLPISVHKRWTTSLRTDREKAPAMLQASLLIGDVKGLLAISVSALPPPPSIHEPIWPVCTTAALTFRNPGLMPQPNTTEQGAVHI